ncbi:hypothetical protein [Candidatus Phytoplasma meliae]|uniref:Uncharacterized protein n=1 Tax=Candidatus Phytoplasma meliae TaxID=1848402 RepID=A0ABS5CXS9_9MOLU|nr:hypothetical protein [Candidatus Phytoplasma meliae]MBP5835775.1 hypothetical protein [Candidatus Phytoplasma meliae]MBP5836214.1 hypothetical protein [Candidatus Phytoplasma meliae]
MAFSQLMLLVVSIFGISFGVIAGALQHCYINREYQCSKKTIIIGYVLDAICIIVGSCGLYSIFIKK